MREFRAKMLLSVRDPINFIYLLLTSVKEPMTAKRKTKHRNQPPASDYKATIRSTRFFSQKKAHPNSWILIELR